MRTLIVEDNAVNRHIIREYLGFYGESDDFEDAKSAIAAFNRAWEEGTPYDLICLDLGMPEMDGHEFLRIIRDFERENKVGDPVKVLIISAFSDEDTVMKTVDRCDAYLKKPILQNTLFEKLDQFGFKPVKPLPVKDGGDDSDDAAGEDESDEDVERLPLIKTENGLAVFYHPVKDESSGEVEFKRGEPQDIPAFMNVTAGTTFAKLADANAPVAAGDGVAIRKATLSCRARKNGRVEYDGKTLSINDTIVSHHNLGRDLDFIGSLEIQGDVKGEVRVKALDGMKIRGNTGPCALESEGDVEFGRMYGNKMGSVRSGGNVIAQCVYEGFVEAEKNVMIQTDTVNSVIKSRGKIFSAGTITGGTAMALREIELNRGGSPKDVSTRFVVGVDFLQANRVESLRGLMDENQKKISKLVKMLGPVADHPEKLNDLSEGRRTRVGPMLDELRAARAENERLANEIELIERDAPSPEGARLRARDVLHKGVEIIIGDKRRLLAEDVAGPVTVTYDPGEDDLIFSKDKE